MKAPDSATTAAGTTTGLPPTHPLVDGRTAQAPLLAAYRGTRPAHRPVWFMRQAGRSLPEYREVRRGIGMLESCLMPDLAAEITLQPVRRHHVDAAILFSDIVVPLKLAGVDVQIVAGTGPVVAEPIRTAADVTRLPALDPLALAPVAAEAAAVVAELGPTPLIGFAGAPFTLASYLVEGGPSRDHRRTKTLMHAEPELWHALARWVAGVTGERSSGTPERSQRATTWAGLLALGLETMTSVCWRGS
jgi:uroporphyrinogen decarboxylase